MTLTKDDLIKKLDIGQLDDTMQQQVLENLANIVAARLWNKIGEVLTDEDLVEADKLMEQGLDEQFGQLVRSKFTNYEEFVENNENEVIEELVAGRKAYNEAFQKLQEQPNTNS